MVENSGLLGRAGLDEGLRAWLDEVLGVLLPPLEPGSLVSLGDETEGIASEDVGGLTSHGFGLGFSVGDDIKMCGV